MEKTILDGQVGPEAKYEVAFKEGNLVATVSYEGKQLGAGVSVTLSSDMVIDAIEAAIPGKIDDAVLEMLRAYLKA